MSTSPTAAPITRASTMSRRPPRIGRAPRDAAGWPLDSTVGSPPMIASPQGITLSPAARIGPEATVTVAGNHEELFPSASPRPHRRRTIFEEDHPLRISMASSCRTHSTPIKAVMVPLDGSAQAEQAIPIAVHLAKLTGAEVRFASVEPPLSIAVMSYDAADPDALTVRELRDQLRHYLTSKAEAARTTHGVRTEISVLRGTPAAALAAYAEAHEVDLIVMTTHGRGGLSRFWLGSVAD